MKAVIDIETYSPCPINAGTARYGEQAELLLASWSTDGVTAEIWDATEGTDVPDGLQDLMWAEYELWAHNSFFERSMLTALAYTQIRLERWRCTMACALAHSLPGSLAKLGEVLGLPQDKRKDTDGKKLIQLFCKPPGQHLKRGRATRATHPTEWARFKSYCQQDVLSTWQVMEKLPRWNYEGDELALWQLDQEINSRGIAVDLALATAAVACSDRAQSSLAARTKVSTKGAVDSTNQRDKLLAYILEEHGVELLDAQASTLERRLNDPDLPDAVRDLIAIRLEASATSVKKYKRLIEATSSDGRLRGTTQFCGAGRTGRWSGRVFQPHNLPRQTLDNEEIDFGIEALKAGAAEVIYGS